MTAIKRCNSNVDHRWEKGGNHDERQEGKDGAGGEDVGQEKRQ